MHPPAYLYLVLAGLSAPGAYYCRCRQRLPGLGAAHSGVRVADRRALCALAGRAPERPERDILGVA